MEESVNSKQKWTEAIPRLREQIEIAKRKSKYGIATPLWRDVELLIAELAAERQRLQDWLTKFCYKDLDEVADELRKRCDDLIAERQRRTAFQALSERTERGILFSRVWAMPSADTFDVPPIAGFVQKYLLKSKVSIDPFARNKRWATYTNDLNPDTAATEHMDAEDFILKYRNVRPDLVIFDPPYSINQIVTTYASFGIDRDNKGVAQWRALQPRS